MAHLTDLARAHLFDATSGIAGVAWHYDDGGGGTGTVVTHDFADLEPHVLEVEHSSTEPAPCLVGGFLEREREVRIDLAVVIAQDDPAVVVLVGRRLDPVRGRWRRRDRTGGSRLALEVARAGVELGDLPERLARSRARSASIMPSRMRA